MSEKRRDKKGRILHNGEIQMSDGRYRFKYVDEMVMKKLFTVGGLTTTIQHLQARKERYL